VPSAPTAHQTAVNSSSDRSSLELFSLGGSLAEFSTASWIRWGTRAEQTCLFFGSQTAAPSRPARSAATFSPSQADRAPVAETARRCLERRLSVISKPWRSCAPNDGLIIAAELAEQRLVQPQQNFARLLGRGAPGNTSPDANDARGQGRRHRP
jgi:hypothetical protein